MIEFDGVLPPDKERTQVMMVECTRGGAGIVEDQWKNAGYGICVVGVVSEPPQVQLAFLTIVTLPTWYRTGNP